MFCSGGRKSCLGGDSAVLGLVAVPLAYRFTVDTATNVSNVQLNEYYQRY